MYSNPPCGILLTRYIIFAAVAWGSAGITGVKTAEIFAAFKGQCCCKNRGVPLLPHHGGKLYKKYLPSPPCHFGLWVAVALRGNVLKRIRLKKTTCFGLGLAAACVTLLGGILMVVGVGQAQYAHTGSLVLGGAMLLFLGVYEKGPENKGRRTKLLLLFFALIIAFLRLPPLDLLEVLVLPCLLAMYGQRGDGGWMALLLAGEIASGAARTLALTSLFGSHGLVVVGGALVFTGLTRGLVLAVLFQRAKAQPEKAEEPGLRRLR